MKEEILEKLHTLLAKASEEQLNEVLNEVQPEPDTEPEVKLRVGYALPSGDEPDTYLSLFVRIG